MTYQGGILKTFKGHQVIKSRDYSLKQIEKDIKDLKSLKKAMSLCL